MTRPIHPRRNNTGSRRRVALLTLSAAVALGFAPRSGPHGSQPHFRAAHATGQPVAARTGEVRRPGKPPRDSDLVDAARAVPGLVVDLPYATKDNVFGRRFYRTDRAFLRRGTARKLKRAQDALRERGLGLKLWDAYRPRSVQKAMWEQVRDPRFVGPPTEGSRHSRGVAVDVTLVDRAGRELPMPTGFDDFSKRAHVNSRNVSPEAARNRATLLRAMTEAGFRPQRTEWWHFNDTQATRYSILDIPTWELARRLPGR